jgi:molybdopterin-guanine dinucleotide biosynthesis protein B
LPQIFALCGYHNSGKTTLGTFLVQSLVKEGYRVGVVKSTKEEGELTDKPGTDTWRYKRAGAQRVALLQKNLLTLYSTSFNESAENLLDYLKSLFFECDILILEGFKAVTGIPKIWILREGESSEEIKRAFSGIELILKPSEKERALEFVKERLRDGFSPEVSLQVNGGEIPLKPFIQNMLKGLIIGFLKSLRGVPEEIRQIEVKIKK